jgi:undecaprenyl diphosphate synthase
VLIYAPDIPDIDLVIRTSGEQRLNNFMLWRAAYSEQLFVDYHWPAFQIDDLEAAFRDYAARQRRFGK